MCCTTTYLTEVLLQNYPPQRRDERERRSPTAPRQSNFSILPLVFPIVIATARFVDDVDDAARKLTITDHRSSDVPRPSRTCLQSSQAAVPPPYPSSTGGGISFASMAHTHPQLYDVANSPSLMLFPGYLGTDSFSFCNRNDCSCSRLPRVSFFTRSKFLRRSISMAWIAPENLLSCLVVPSI
jgi:hypothetical protein